MILLEEGATALEIREYIEANPGKLQPGEILARAFQSFDYTVLESKDVRNALNNAWKYIRKMYGHSTWGANTHGAIKALIGPSEPVPAKEGDEVCAGGDHRLHSCGCAVPQNCSCVVVDTDVVKICKACEGCMVCCEEAGDCYECPSCNTRVERSDSGQCSCCDCCDDCCQAKGACHFCEGCQETKGSNCGKCDRCNGCCDCWSCDYCGSKYSSGSDTSNCDVCGRCENCCKCAHCDSCGVAQAASVGVCNGCSECKSGCDCEGGFQVKATCSYCGGLTSSPCPKCLRCRTNYGGCCRCPKAPAWATAHVPLTQKAKGMKALACIPGNMLNMPVYMVLKATDFKPYHLVGKFVRPCPMTPRHGFVDSHVVKTEEAATAMINATIAADPDAEIVTMACIAATHSAVWTTGLLVLGPGNDGATAGHGSVSIPIGGDFLMGNKEVLQQAGIQHSPYIEMLWSESGYGKEYGSPKAPEFNAVQLRDGPAVPQQVDYIEAQTVVSNVVMAGGDLLEWETLMKNQPAGTAVYHPGGSLASHYAVHAMLNHVPVMVSREPKAGDILLPISGEDALTPDMGAMRAGFMYGVRADVAASVAAHMMLLGCHSTVTWLGKQDLLLGLALGCCYRLSITAALGEWRYKASVCEGNKSGHCSRTMMYERIWKRVHRKRGLYIQALKDFRQLRWTEAVGGEKWYDFTQWAAVMFNAVRRGDAKEALEAMNKAVHASHNGGWGFNKFVDENVMNAAAANPVRMVTKCGPFMHAAMQDALARKKAAKAWFRNSKPYPTYKMDKWLDIPVPLDKAMMVQARLEEDKLIVNCVPCKNSKVVATHVVPIVPEDIPKVREIVEKYDMFNGLSKSYKAGDGGRYMPLSPGTRYNKENMLVAGHSVYIYAGGVTLRLQIPHEGMAYVTSH